MAAGANVQRTAQRPLLWLPYKATGGDDGPGITAALAVMKNLGGVRLLTDVAVATPITLPSGGPVTLDCNGKTIASTVDPSLGAFPAGGSVIRCSLGAPAASTTIASFTPGSATLVVASAAGATVGGVVQIEDTSTGWEAIYQIERINGTTLTLERPLPPYPGLYTVGDAAIFYNASQVPQRLTIEGNGALIHGTAVVTISMQSARFSTVSNFRFAGATATAPSDAFGVFNFGCFGCSAWNLFCDGYDIATHLPAGAPSVGLGIQSGEACSIWNSHVRHVGGFGAGFLESYLCNFFELHVSDAAFGVVYCDDVVPTTGSYDCWVVGGSAGQCRNDGVIPFDGSTNCGISRFLSYNNVGNGITVSGASETVTTQNFQIVNCALRGNAIGLLVNAHASATQVVGGSISENTTADVSCQADLFDANVRTQNATATGILWLLSTSDDVWIKGVEIEHTGSSALAAFKVTSGRVHIENCSVDLGHSSDIGVWAQIATEVVTLFGARIQPIGGAVSTFGIFTNGGTIRFAGLDADACTTPTLLAAGGFLSGTQTFTLDVGGAAVSVPWPNLKTNDQVLATPIVAGGTRGHEPIIVQTPGVGFTAQGDALDTTQYLYRIEGG
jgi:hypothetical protein